MGTRLERRVISKTANYTISPPMDQPGTTFTNAGAAGPITFTLPQPNQAMLGWWFRFRMVTVQNVVVATPVVDTLLAINDVAATSVTSTVVGGEIEAVCIKNSIGNFQWAANGIAAGGTYTIQP